MKDNEKLEQAKKSVEEKIGFYIHLTIYILISIFLVVVNKSTSPEYSWFKWPILGWGVGVLGHWFSVYLFSEGSSIKKRMIEKEIKKMSS